MQSQQSFAWIADSKFELSLTIKKETLVAWNKAWDLPLFRKFVRKMKWSKRKIVYGQIFEKAANLSPYSRIDPENVFNRRRRKEMKVGSRGFLFFLSSWGSFYFCISFISTVFPPSLFFHSIQPLLKFVRLVVVIIHDSLIKKYAESPIKVVNHISKPQALLLFRKFCYQLLCVYCPSFCRQFFEWAANLMP